MTASIQTEEESTLEPPSYPIGDYIASLREAAGLTQAQLAQTVTFSTATLSRIESGDKTVTAEEIRSLLEAIGSPKAAQFGDFLSQSWDQVERPAFDHPNRDSLWSANISLRKLAKLREDTGLKAVFLRQVDLYADELRRAVEFLKRCDHQIGFVGSIGVGKSTAICKLTGLLKSHEEKLDRQIVLETGAGGITLCEVHIASGPRYGIRIIPRSEESIRGDVEDFCDYLITVSKPVPSSPQPEDEEGDPLGISKEVVRAIRNMADLTEKRREENGKRLRVDPAKELAKQIGSPQELCIQILTRMELLRRNRRDAWYPEHCNDSPMQWMQQRFAAINNGRDPEFTLPQKIEIIIPAPILENTDFALRIIDTKGIDQTAERQDIESLFDEARTLLILCSRFNDAPEVPLQTLLKRAREIGARDIALKTAILVLPRPDEALAVKHDDGMHVEDENEGYELKCDQIRLRLNQHGCADIPVLFFNARDEQPQTVNSKLFQLLVAHRQQYAEKITRLNEAVGRLEENRGDEEVRLVFEHVMKDIGSWIEHNREMELSEAGVQLPLLEAIDSTRFASTVRAAVRRYGDWWNLDYYHHLAFGVRKLGVEQIGRRMSELTVILKNLVTNSDLSPAASFLQEFSGRIETALDESYKRLQASGREAFKQTLAKDHAFWERCEQRWGQGKGYRQAIRDLTDQEIENSRVELERILKGLLAAEWANLVSLLNGLLAQRPIV